MTLEDAIVYYSEMAKKCRWKARIESTDYMDIKDRAYEAEQLADWLNELKVLREKIDVWKKDVQPEQRWISCSKQLPEEDGQYIITVKYKHVNDNYKDVYAEHGEWYDGRWDIFCFGHCGEVEDIIAWMPLPEPYKEEGGQDETG